MNIKKLTTTIALGALLTAASAAAVAGSLGRYQTGSQWLQEIRNTQSTVTRAEVNNEVLMAREQGTLQINNATYPVLAESAAVPRSRSEVRAEAIQSVQDGGVSSLYTGG